MFTMTFSTANDAFSDRPENEVARILRDVALKVSANETNGRVIDTNGNTVGKWKFDTR